MMRFKEGDPNGKGHFGGDARYGGAPENWGRAPSKATQYFAIRVLG